MPACFLIVGLDLKCDTHYTRHMRYFLVILSLHVMTLPLSGQNINAGVGAKPESRKPTTTTKEYKVTGAPIRTWTSSSGTTIEARLVRFSSADVHLQNNSGAIRKIPRKSLSEKDNAHLEKMRKTIESATPAN